MKKLPALLFLLLALPIYADTIVSGTISADTTWSPAGGVYIIDSSFSVAPGMTLTIEPGTIIKSKTTGVGGPSIYGQVIAHGSSELPIYFTSIYDDSVGGDTGIDGPTTGTVKDWQGLYFKSGSTGSFDHVTVRYAGQGGFGFGDYLGIENDGGSLTVRNSLIDQNNQHGIWQKVGALVLENTVISNHLFGLTVWSGTTTAISNHFLSNSQYGLHVSGGETLTLTGNDFSGNVRTAYVLASLDFSHSGNTSSDIVNRGFETGGEAKDGAVWDTSDLPFIVNGLTVGPGKTFTLSPGTVLKMNPGAYLDVRGTLVSNGTASAPVYFTSLKDDSILGDTNGDGIASLPNLTDWNGISFYESSVGNISHSLIKYSGGFVGSGRGSGRSGIFNLGGTLLLDNVSFSNNFQSDVYQNAGSLTATKTDFNNQHYGIIFDGGTGAIFQSKFSALSNAIGNHTGVIIDARNNWWGSVTGPRTTENPAGTGGAIFGPVLYFPWLTSDPLLEPPPVPPEPVIPECCSSVLFIPGFMASDLYVQGAIFENQLWPPTSLLKSDIQKLMLDLDGNPVTSGIYTKGVISEAFGFNIYKSFIQKMNDLVTRGDLTEWEAFPYDWRKDISKVVNESTVVKIGNGFENKKLIDEAIALAQRSPTGKITIIGHSNGGIVGKALIKELVDQGKGDIVDQFVMVATPQIGTPKAIAGLLHGDQQAILFGLLLDKETARSLGHNMQSGYNLLPSQSYFNNVSDLVIKFEDSINQVFNYSANGFPQSVSSYSGMFNFLTSSNRGNTSGEPTNIPSTLISSFANNANANIESLANWPISSNVKVTEIAGWGEQTIKAIDYRSKQENICSNQEGSYTCQSQNVWDRRLLMTDDGDGTVVIPSATNYTTTNEYYLNLFNLNAGIGINLKHHNILEALSVLDLISEITKNIVDNNSLPSYFYTQKPASTNQSLQLSVHSPVSIGVINSQGKYTGISSTTPTDAFTFIQEDIPNSYYLEIGDDKYIGLSNSENYSVNIQGEGTGTFTFNQEITQDDQIIDSKSFVNIPVTPLTKASLSLSGGNLSPTLNLDMDGNGSIDVQVQANNQFDPIAYLTVMKSVIKSFNLKKAQENNLLNKIDNLIKLIQKGKIQKASAKSQTYINKLNQKLEKINNGQKSKKGRKLTQEEIQIIIQNLEEFIDNLK